MKLTGHTCVLQQFDKFCILQKPELNNFADIRPKLKTAFYRSHFGHCVISENLHTVDISGPVLPTNLPRLVNVVCERPTSLKWIIISLHTMCSIHVFLFLTHVKIPENSINY